MARRLSRRRRRRLAVQERVLERDLDGLRAMWADDPNLLSGLVGLLNERDDLVRWRAIEALGELCGEAARSDVEVARRQVRRQVWNMSEESGNQGWSAAEAIGAILYHVPELAEEYAVIVVRYEEEPIFRAGAFWAMAHLAPQYPDLLRPEAGIAALRLGDENPLVRAHAARALGLLGYAAARAELEALTSDEAEVTLYSFETGQLSQTTVGEVARAALRALEQSPAS
jgi:HEAT repeat protein